ncbi:NAD(P)-dependent alcohol dehydrogenase [Nonomuraea turcica]|uniref:NAD(P)-dependent alcohol dehydrogenase n=1 Tax=Nonomuraea sp. G32 TaxID=3067274 RepID=UPI00273C5640|nr:NAD(P)-dependent alcohol dehydrogenase [Nonomuraea sp. G32]MDP4503163.1 NAD(P)-dependent alcohol dehydrogenase [Nonomuraea sp. G32]
MRAVTYYKYGAPDVLGIEEVQTPAPGDKDVLVRIHAALVTATDAIFRVGSPFFARMFTGPIKPKAKTLGGEFAGEVVAVGKDVTCFSVGDQVFGDTGPALGAHAEYVCVPEDGALAVMPAGLDYAQAVAVLDGVLTALPFLRDNAHLREGQEILINGAAGGVGAAAVRLAKKHFGARVTGVCSTAKLELVKSLGADEVVDYTKEDFTRAGRTYDVVFDAAGKSSFSRSRRVLNSGGVYLSTVPSPGILLQSFWTRKFGDKRAVIAFTGLRPTTDKAEDLRFLTQITEAGQMRPAIDGRYPLAEAAEAHRRVDSGRRQGSVLIIMEHNGN